MAVSLGLLLFSETGSPLYGWYFVVCFWTGAFVGSVWPKSGSSVGVEIRFLFTRPIPRSAVILRPLAIASFATAVFAITPLGWRVLAIDFVRFYLAAVSIGLCGYALAVSQRWLELSPNKGLRMLDGIVGLFLYLPVWLSFLQYLLPWLFNSAPVRLLLLWAPSRADLEYVPSTTGIALHFAFAAGVLYGCWRILQHIELSGYSSRADDSWAAIRASQAARAARATK